MLRPLLFVSVFLTLRCTFGQDCNICGDGNSIQYSVGVVEFIYQGKSVKNSCKNWQDVVKNVNAISDEFCRNEMLQYTKDVCRCTTPDGDLLSDISPPTVAPTPSSVFVKSPTSNVTSKESDTLTNETKVVAKCEQANANGKGCNDNEVKRTSSAPGRMLLISLWSILCSVSVQVLFSLLG
jgi:hypothetical protein